MKKMIAFLVVSFLLTLFVGNSVSANVAVKLGYDYYGYYSMNNQSQTVNPSYSLALELINADPDNKQLEWGAGFETEFLRKIKNTNQSFQFIPAYALINYNLTKQDITPYFTTRLGWDILSGPNNFKNNASLQGGPYYALGFGYNFSGRTKTEILYSVCNGTKGGSGLHYSHINLIFGYSL